jgi:3-methyladenine DNA glycosylase AlkD
MTLEETMAELERLGTAQNRKVYARHGFSENMFGVSFANLKKLTKVIKTNHALAGGLWATGNEDARMLATMIADPAAMKAKDLDTWVSDIHHYALADVFVGNVASKCRLAAKKAEKWRKSKKDNVSQAGWDLVAHMAMDENGSGDAVFEQYLEKIEAGIQQAPNRTRHAMNSALIAIGIRNSALQKKAVAAARRIGKVEVDHGETSCKTPEAIPYIKKSWERKKERT